MCSCPRYGKLLASDVQNGSVVEQIVGAPVPLDHGERRGSYTSGTRAESLSWSRSWVSLYPRSWRPPWKLRRLVPQERVPNCTPEQIVDVPVPQIMEESLPALPQERVQNRTLEQIVDVPVPLTL